jgi:hypothetical protein
MIDQYFQELQVIIAETVIITASSLHTERRSETIGFVRGDLTFEDGSRLHFREFVRKVEDAPADRYTYVYHYQSVEDKIIFRYDNTRHFPALENAPHHKLMGEADVIPTIAPDLKQVLKEIEEQMSHGAGCTS